MNATTKTRKQEALELLALDTLTDKQKWELDILTLKQIGWAVKKTRNGYYAAHNPAGEIDMGMDIFMSEDEGWVWVRKVHPFCTSVDACLGLPIPETHFWELIADSNGAADVRLRVVMTNQKYINAKAAPLAMLKAWWSIQPDTAE